MLLGVFEHLRPNHPMPTWHRQHNRRGFDSFGYWTKLGRMLDEAGFDFLFLADSYGYPTVDGAMPADMARLGIQFPGLDPLPFASAVAAATTDLGIVLTSSTTTEAPYATARRFASLDQASDGRVGWNVVTGSAQASVAALFGHAEMIPHDRRYEIAEEFVDVAVALWEETWDDRALRDDPASGVYIDEEGLHPLAHHGRHFRVDGVLTVAPTPQRTPVLFQAGTSDRGREFGVRVAEAIFMQGRSVAQAASVVADLRSRAARADRGRDDLRVVSGATVLVGHTEREARERLAEFESLRDIDAAAVIYAGFTGIDLRAFPLDEPLPVTSTEQGQSALNRYVQPGRPVPTPREILTDFQTQAGSGFLVVGTPEQVADELISIQLGADLDGFMIEPSLGGLEPYAEFISLVLPILRERGAVGPRRSGLSLRERLFPGSGPRMNPAHPLRRASNDHRTA